MNVCTYIQGPPFFPLHFLLCLVYYDHRLSGRSSGVEHNLAKVGVEGSNPFARSILTFLKLYLFMLDLKIGSETLQFLSVNVRFA